MRFIKASIIGLLVLFILLTVIGLLMPSSVTVGRSVQINMPVDSVRFYTNNIANWKYWINGADTAYFNQLTNSATDKDSKVVMGAYTITVIKNDPKYIITVWKNASSREQLSRLELYSNGLNNTTVNWSFTQQLNWYFWERLSAMLRDKVFGPSDFVSISKNFFSLPLDVVRKLTASCFTSGLCQKE